MNIPQLKLSVKVLNNIKQSDLLQIKDSLKAYQILKNCFDNDTFHIQEEFIILMLNNSNKVIGFQSLSKGGLNSTIVDLRLIFSTAIKVFATGLILAHNHPSGTLQPSEADKTITKKIKEAGQLLDIKLIDHIILTDENYFSFGDDGIL